jgi:hypothetical protein
MMATIIDLQYHYCIGMNIWFYNQGVLPPNIDIYHQSINVVAAGAQAFLKDYPQG